MSGRDPDEFIYLFGLSKELTQATKRKNRIETSDNKRKF